MKLKIIPFGTKDFFYPRISTFFSIRVKNILFTASNLQKMSPAAFVFPTKRPFFKRPQRLFGVRSGHHQGPPTRLRSFLDLHGIRSTIRRDSVHVFLFEVLHIIWVFPKLGVPQNRWFIMENPIKMDDLGVETSIYC